MCAMSIQHRDLSLVGAANNHKTNIRYECVTKFSGLQRITFRGLGFAYHGYVPLFLLFE